mmetsp:Transcript_5404/g.8611  ORF Transcript_5404/g.8611 Transcript_5404/m.8611 type:complete len:133 (-) Transcript_5404:165-563(-)
MLALASALILPIDNLHRQEAAAARAAEVEAAQVEPLEQKAFNINIGHAVLCGNAIAIGVVTAAWKWSERVINGQGAACDSFKEDFSASSSAAAESITPFGGYVLRNHLFGGKTDSEVAAPPAAEPAPATAVV